MTLTIIVHTIIDVKIVFDAAKEQTNFSKHGVSLGDSRLIEWETLWAFEDCRHDYGEVRMIGYAYIGRRLYCVVYTDRGSQRRVISLRKANRREVNNYANA